MCWKSMQHPGVCWGHLLVPWLLLLLLLITSLAKEVMFLVRLVCLSVCLSVPGQHYSKSYERIRMKFYGGVLGSAMKNWLNFGGDLGILRWVNEQKNTIIVVAYPDRGACNDPKPFFFFLFNFILFIFSGGVSLSSPRLNIFTVGNMGVMVCLGQGGLCSLSASSSKVAFIQQLRPATPGLWDSSNCMQSLPQPIALASVVAFLASGRLCLFT